MTTRNSAKPVPARQGQQRQSRQKQSPACQILGLVLALSVLPSLAARADNDTFTFRGIPVGISLDGFRALHHPDAARHPESRVVCSGDAEKLAEVDPADAAAGLKQCNFFSRRSVAGGPATWQRDDILFRDAPVAASFDFFPDPDEKGIYRLARIRVLDRPARFAIVVDAESKLFGPPARLAKSPAATNGYGMALEATTAIWVGGEDAVVVREYTPMLDKMDVTYLYRRLSRLYSQAVQAEKADAIQ